MKVILISDSYGFLIGKVLQSLETEFIEKLKTFEITARQYGVLIKINEQGNLSQKEIAVELKIDRTTMVEHAELLESLNYITRVRNLKDKRTYCLNLTDQGREVLEKCWGLLQQAENHVLSSLSDDEKSDFKKYLLKIYNTRRNV